jgi:hypothetical protein
MQGKIEEEIACILRDCQCAFFAIVRWREAIFFLACIFASSLAEIETEDKVL